ncbi:MMPL family transporter [Stieleria varia]|uniref:Membrane transport protein mmpL8 n=1 Tax=Stieleria varia TaxID=2528005 RepID=A0A5C6AXU3_9BACT|nr:MMPL family transporter [Stieleria varia]TWU04560.1 Membrane transport protein mmpL8 [Stieleria varia]
MQITASDRWSDRVIQRWRWILAFWVLASVLLFWAAPKWDKIAYDGDFDYLPAEMTSVAAGKLLDEAFRQDRSRSEIVLVLGRDHGDLKESDLVVGLDLLRRLHHRLGEVCWQNAITRFGYEQGPIDEAGEAGPWLRQALDSFNHAIDIDERFYESITDQLPDQEPTLVQPRLAIAYWDRATLLERIGDPENSAASDFQDALVLVPSIKTDVTPIQSRDLSAWQSMMDVLSWNDPVIGSRLSKPGARLTVVQLRSELAATSNITTVEAMRGLLSEVLNDSSVRTEPGLRLEMTGSAAIGGETLIAARDAIRYTESITVVMILLILITVYRAPLLVAIPMVSIGCAVVVSTSLIALLAGWSLNETVPWLDVRIFTTSRIFIVVILFGAGTDYCLFLISRLREEAGKYPWPEACRKALSGVTGALLGSAMTTVVGLGMLWIAQFGKFHYTGPIIAICLLVGLLICTTLTPALLRALGPGVFWPSKVLQNTEPPVSLLGQGTSSQSATMGGGVWSWIALMITRRPWLAMGIGMVGLILPGIYGLVNESNVTYDLSSQLSSTSGSRRGFRLLADHFEIGEINPVTLLLVRPDAVPREQFKKEIKKLSDTLYQQEGVATVRTFSDPLGDFPPNREMSILSSDAWKRRALQKHRIAQRHFFSTNAELSDRLARLDVIIHGDPFSNETASLVSALDQKLNELAADDDSVWKGSKVYLAGTTPSIIDLRSVTLSDNRRIKIAVVLAVFVVLLLVIRRVMLCVYLIATVLLSYYATLGLTALFFQQAYGSEFVGLDWKLPLFLFVILVAVGQDYNVYLVTRILEEQENLGWRIALRRAVAKTGGIITACGLVMAATFFSMTSSAWFPQIAAWFGYHSGTGVGLKGIIELGFALGLGVLIDTFYVRTILVPSYVSLTGRLASSGDAKTAVSHPDDSQGNA